MCWREFAALYRAQLDGAALAAAQAFCEAARARDESAIFLCAEPDCAHFSGLAPAEQDQHCCHRFALTDLA